MATVAAVIASTHHPFYLKASTATGAERPPFADEWVSKIEDFRDTLTRAEPDVLVMVGSDHFHQLWLDNMPQFLVGKAPVYDANWYNEEREFGLPRFRLDGHEELSSHILRGGLDAGFDLAFSNELRIDHSLRLADCLGQHGDASASLRYADVLALTHELGDARRERGADAEVRQVRGSLPLCVAADGVTVRAAFGLK